MDKRLKIKDIICEGLSDKLYHFSPFDAAAKIITSNTLTSKSGEISFSRTVHGSYQRDYRFVGVIFCVDGRKLKQKYKGAPVGAENFTYDEEDYDPDDRSTWEFMGKSGQAEDRINASSIENFMSYVTGVLVYCPLNFIKDNWNDEFGNSYTESLSHIGNFLKVNKHPLKFIMSEQVSKTTDSLEVFAKEVYAVLDESTPSPLKELAEKDQKHTWEVHCNLYDKDAMEGEYEPDQHVVEYVASNAAEVVQLIKRENFNKLSNNQLDVVLVFIDSVTNTDNGKVVELNMEIQRP